MPERNSRQNDWREYHHDSGETLGFRFVRSARKSIALYVHRDGSVMVRAPLRAPYAQIFMFLRERWDWLQIQRARFLEEPAPAPFTYDDGEAFLHLGEPMMLRVRHGSRNQAVQIAGELIVTLTDERWEDEDALPDVIGLWQRREAQRVFPLRLAFCHEAMHALCLPFPELKIRKMRSRWGSCTRGGVVTLNLELIRMPLPCIDYVITHELCHLMELNHSKAFHDLLCSVDPEAKKHAIQLRRAWSYVPGWALR
jgi:predicted metal-dependent hydrolase